METNDTNQVNENGKIDSKESEEQKSDFTEGNENCPSCGYFVGIESVCVRCGANIKTRTSIKAVRKLSILGAFVGLIILWVAAYLKSPESVKIADITETMNNAFVVIEGQVVGLVMNEEKNSLKITINDGSGNMKINAFNKLDKFRKRLKDKMPGLYDKFRVTGALNISQSWGASMFLSIPDRLELVEKYEIDQRKISEITEEDEGKIISIRATIKEYYEKKTKRGNVLHNLVLKDESGTMPMVLFESELKYVPSEIQEKIKRRGSTLDMEVRVGTYRGTLQVKPVDLKNPDKYKIISTGVKDDGKIKIDTGKLEIKRVETLSIDDAGSLFLMDIPIRTIELMPDTIMLKTYDKDKSITITYEDQDKISNFSRLNDGKGRIKGAFRVKYRNNKYDLVIEDISTISIK